jgi:ssDNA-binding Zn-finger/Zn-ribbon topoisomerase 1
MSRFHNVSQAEMEAFLLPKGFRQMTLPGTAELVYGKRINKGRHAISIRVYTAINPSGVARACGEDAIRVSAFTLFQGEPVSVGKSQKVLRITTWAKNLDAALSRWDAEWKECPACGHPMVLRNGKHGDFWGCSTYAKTKCSGKPPSAPQIIEPKAEVTVIKASRPMINGYRIPEDRISTQQKAAEVAFTNTDKNLILPSRAGGGKTTMLKHIASFRGEGQRMVYLAFNKKNADEGKKKLPREVVSMTTHSFCGRLLRDNNIPMPQRAESSKNRQVMEEVYPALDNKDRKRIRRAAFKMIGLAKNFACRPGDREAIKAVLDQYPFELENKAEEMTVVEIVDEVLRLSIPGSKFGSIYDFDDMIWWPVVLDLKPTHYDVALLDEVQDFNACQIELVRRLMASGTRLVAVGDPYQAVYRFRGADSDAFDKVSEALNGSDRGCETVLLPTNYRCAKSIIDWVRDNTVVHDIEAAPNAPQGSVREDLSYDKIIDLLALEFGRG